MIHITVSSRSSSAVILHLLCILLALQQRFLWFTLYLQQPRRTKMSVDSDDVKERRFANCHSLVLYQRKWWSLNSGLAVS